VTVSVNSEVAKVNRRLRRWALALAGTALVVGMATGCGEDLGVPPGSVHDIGPDGLVVGSTFDGRYGTASVWNPATGARAALGPHGDVGDVVTYGLSRANGLGQVAGTMYVPLMGDGIGPDRPHAIVWDVTTGDVRDLDGLIREPNRGTRATAINDSGIVAGEMLYVRDDPRDEVPVTDWRAVRWDLRTGEATVLLPGPEGARTTATDVNEAGAVLVNHYARSWLWEPSTGVARPLTVPGRAQVQATALNDTGDVVGWADTTLDEKHEPTAVRWDAATGGATVLPDLGGGWSEAADVNDAHVVVGTAATATGERHAFRVSAGAAEATDLGTLGGDTSRALRVDAGGRVFGLATVEGSPTEHVTRWEP
jgi:probable HAF family extracellular repeat protein